MGTGEVGQQLLVCRRFLERIELGPVQVFQKSVPQHVVVLGVTDDGGDRIAAGELGGAQSAFPHDQLVAGLVAFIARGLVTCGIVRHAAHHDGLENAELADAVDQLRQVVLVEDLPGLAWIRPDVLDPHLGERRTRDRCEIGLLVRRDAHGGLGRLGSGIGRHVSRETVAVCTVRRRCSAREEDVPGTILCLRLRGDERPQTPSQSSTTFAHAVFTSWRRISAAASA